jgi:hypothetical protein
MPSLIQERGTNMDVQRSPIPADSGQAFKIGALVKNVSGEAVVCVTAETLVWGQTPTDAFADGTRPPTSLYNNLVYAFDLQNAVLEINTGKANGTDVTLGTSTTNSAGACTIGTSYGILVPTTGTYAGVPFLDPTNTTNDVFTVTGYIAGQDNDDYNSRLYAKLVAAAIQ